MWSVLVDAEDLVGSLLREPYLRPGIDAEDLVDSLLREPYLRLGRRDDEVARYLDLIKYVRVVDVHIENVIHDDYS
jgi:hypothetical protein